MGGTQAAAQEKRSLQELPAFALHLCRCLAADQVHPLVWSKWILHRKLKYSFFRDGIVKIK